MTFMMFVKYIFIHYATLNLSLKNIRIIVNVGYH